MTALKSKPRISEIINIFDLKDQGITIKYFIMLFVLIAAQSQGQQNLSGKVLEECSGEPIQFAMIFVKNDPNPKFTDEYGRFYLTNVPDSVEIEISRVGYESVKVVRKVMSKAVLEFALKCRVMQEVEIKSTSIIPPIASGLITFSAEELGKAPLLFGEADPMRFASLFPGITLATDTKAGLIVRGGGVDQNLIMLDEAPLYNLSHLFGFFSIINPDIIRQVSVYKGFFPSAFGGRLSSVMNIHLKEGNSVNHSQKYSIGLLSSKGVWEGPLFNKKASYLLAARTAYPLLVTLPLQWNYNKGKRDNFFSYYMYDINAKFNFSTGHDSKILLSFYTGKDELGTGARSENLETLDNFTSWGNTNASIRYQKGLGSDAVLYSSFSITNYGLHNSIDVTTQSDQYNVSVSSSIDDYRHRSRVFYQISSNIGSEIGLEIAYQTLNPQNVNLSSALDSFDFLQAGSFPQIHILTGAAFLELKSQLFEKLQLVTGLRYNAIKMDNAFYPIWEPRTELIFKQNSSSQWTLAYGRMHQVLQQVASNNGALSNDIWYSLPDQHPSISDQISAGWQKNISNKPNSSLKLQTEVFYKFQQHLIDIAEGAGFVFFGTAEEGSIFSSDGNGQVMGLEILLDYKWREWTGWISYTLSKNERQFSDINNGQTFPFKYDRRHDLSITVMRQINKKWHVSLNFVLQNGARYTRPDGLIWHSGFERWISVYTKRNNGTLPLYHRLDFGFSKYCHTKRNKEYTMKFGLYNALFQPNPLGQLAYTTDSFIRDVYRVDKFGFSYMVFLPYLTFEW